MKRPQSENGNAWEKLDSDWEAVLGLCLIRSTRGLTPEDGEAFLRGVAPRE